jgi:hypothetical protein
LAVALKGVSAINKAEKKVTEKLKDKGFTNIRFQMTAMINWNIQDPDKNPRSGKVTYTISILDIVTAKKGGKEFKEAIRLGTVDGSFFDENLETTGMNPNRRPIKVFPPKK